MQFPFPAAIDSTARKDFAMCNKRFFYSSVQKIRPAGGNIHLIFGGCFARGLEVTRKAYYGDGMSPAEALNMGAQAFIKEWGEYEPPDNSNKNLSTGLVALYEYFQQYPLAEDIIKPVMINGKPAVEFDFAFPIPDTKHPETGDPILYTGRFDMLASYGNTVWVEDDKTASSLGASWAQQWKLASQMTGYCAAAKYFGHPVQGAIIRGVGILKKSITHQMCMESRPQWMIDRWMEQLKRDVARMIAAWEEGYWNYDLDHSCGTYGGCPYLNLCTTPDPEKWIDGYYEYHNWNPLEKDAE